MERKFSMQFSNRVQRVKPSPTLVVSALSAKLKAEGRDIIGLGVGEPDFDTPAHICEAGVKAIMEGYTRYTAVDGIPSLKSAIINKFKRENDFSFELDEVLVSSGAKQSIYNLLQALLNEGDEVIIPAPYWVSYPDMVLLADAVPVIVESGYDDHFKLSPEKLEAAITPKTKLLMINSPSNPTGVSYSRDELAALGEVLLQHPNVVVVTDDIYEHILFGDTGFVNILNATPALRERCVVINGVSKAYAMTGWRIGYAAGPKDLIRAMKIIQMQSTSNASSIAQHAAVAALDGDQTCIDIMVKAYRERHDFVVAAANDIPGMKCLPSDGTFYNFCNVEEMLSRVNGVSNDTELASLLLDKTGVALIPGSAFGLGDHIRISFATSMENLEQAMERIASIVK